MYYRFFIFFTFLLFGDSLAAVTLNLDTIKQMRPTVPSTVPSTVTQCNAGCLTGWVPYSGNCYKKFEANVTQGVAEKSCISYGAHLTSIESGLEAKALKYLILEAPLFSTELSTFLSSSQMAWIGLSKKKNGAWTWTDSSEVLYTNLPSGESTTAKSCATINGTRWLPTTCSSTALAYICKMSSSL